MYHIHASLTFLQLEITGYTVEKLTATQRRGLVSSFNLADAHARQALSPAEEQVIDRLPNSFRTAITANPVELEAATFISLMSLMGQLEANSFPRLASMSASVSTEIVANVLRHQPCTIHLAEPCFDNIPDILRRHGLRIIPFRLNQAIDAVKFGDALFLLSPNNPTGVLLNEEEFRALAHTSATRGVLLILDFCFRAFDPIQCSFDQYAILREEGTSFIAIEDSGKIWPTLDQKVSFIICSHEHYEALSRVHEDFLLEVSPLTLKIVRSFSDISNIESLASVRSLIESNRRVLRSRLDVGDLPLQPVNLFSNVSVEWLLLAPPLSAAEVAQHSAKSGVFIHPGQPFYWANPADGDSFIRIALARSTGYFESGIARFFAVVDQLGWFRE